MKDHPQCFECRAIVEEVRAAAAGRWPELRADSRRIMAATADEIEELLARFPFRHQSSAVPKLADDRSAAMVPLFRKMLAHGLRTGHNAVDLFRK